VAVIFPACDAFSLGSCEKIVGPSEKATDFMRSARVKCVDLFAEFVHDTENGRPANEHHPRKTRSTAKIQKAPQWGFFIL
jgi:hypothetical protein